MKNEAELAAIDDLNTIKNYISGSMADINQAQNSLEQALKSEGDVKQSHLDQALSSLREINLPSKLGLDSGDLALVAIGAVEITSH